SWLPVRVVTGRRRRRVSRLFTKILLWFLLTVIVSSTASFYIWNTFLRTPQPQFNGRNYEMHEARTAWENGGREGLERFLKHYREVTSAADAILTDASGKDVLTGRDWSADLQPEFRGRGGPMFPFLRI